MKNHRMPILALVCALVLLGSLSLSFISTALSMRSGSSNITLPTDRTGGDIGEQGESRDPDAAWRDIEVSVQNVQQVVAQMERVADYSAVCQLEYGWSGGSGQRQKNVFAAAGRMKIVSLDAQGGEVYHQMLTKENYYSWQSGQSGYYQSVRGDWTEDLAQQMPTYELLLEAPAEELTLAYVDQWNDQPAIFAQRESQDTVYKYWISTQSGLLVCFEQWQGDSLLLRAVLQNLTLETPEESRFALPETA